MTLRIQARRAAAVSENELVYIGEIFYDDSRKRFGVFSNEDAITIRWLPRWFNNDLALNAGQNLAGMVTDTDVNNIVLDFSRQDAILFKNSKTNEVYMELTPNGVAFLRANDDITEIAGTSNIAINGNIAIKRSVGAETSFTTNIDGNTFMFAPNWYVYSYPSSSGMLTVSYEESDVYAEDTILNRAIRVNASGNVTNCGLRSFFYDYPFVQDRFVTATFRVKGPIGYTATSKILSETNTVLASVEIVGTGEYQTVSYPCFMPPSDAKWWAIDTLFEPGKDSSFSSNWLVGGLQVNIGTTSSILERRSIAVEQALVDSLYKEGRILIIGDLIEHPVNTPDFSFPIDAVEVFNPQDGNPVVSDIDTTGFNLSIHGTSASNFIVSYAAFLAPSPIPDI